MAFQSPNCTPFQAPAPTSRVFLQGILAKNILPINGLLCIFTNKQLLCTPFKGQNNLFLDFKFFYQYFNQHLECAAPKRSSKYKTNPLFYTNRTQKIPCMFNNWRINHFQDKKTYKIYFLTGTGLAQFEKIWSRSQLLFVPLAGLVPAVEKYCPKE